MSTRPVTPSPAPGDEVQPDAGVDREPVPAPPSAARGRARNTVIFGVATGASRISGLAREAVSGALYGTGGPASAFTIAFAVPNLLRSLFADMALSAAFVPVFSDLLERGRRREAILLASTLFWIMLIALGALVGVAVLTAPLYMPLFFSSDMDGIEGLAVGLTRLLMPTVLLLGLNGVLVGVLNALDHFTVPALSPLLWNGVIIVANLALLPAFDGQDQIYAQAVGVLIGTVAQLLIAVPVLRRYEIRLVPHIDRHDPRVRQVFLLMIPVALSLGLVNFSALIDLTLGERIGEQVPRQIDAAFRLYMLPQGVFSVAIVTVLFPAMSRAVSRRDDDELRGLLGNGMLQISALLIPIGLLFMNPTISRAIIELVMERVNWDRSSTAGTADALVWFGPSLALNGISLLLSRTFFALQRPWANTGLSAASLLVNAAASFALYRPLGIAGIVLGTFVANAALVAAQLWLLRRTTAGAPALRPVARAVVRVLLAGLVGLAVGSLVIWAGQAVYGDLDPGVARFATVLVALGLALGSGLAAYGAAVSALDVQALRPATARFGRLGRKIGLLPGVRGLLRAARSPHARRLGALAAAVLRPLGTLLRVLADLLCRPFEERRSDRRN